MAMAELEPLTVQSVQFMITSLDRFESFAMMFHNTIVDSENETLNELCLRLPTLFARSTSVETQQDAINHLVAYILNPLNSQKITNKLFSGIVEALQSQESAATGTGVRLVLAALLRPDVTFLSSSRQTNMASIFGPVIGLLDVNTTREILSEVVKKVFEFLKNQSPDKSSGKRKRFNREALATAEAQQAFLRQLLDGGRSTVPLVVVLQELGKHMPNANYYKAFASPLGGFYRQAGRVLSLLRIQGQEECFPVLGYSLVGSPLWSIDKQSLLFTSPIGLSFAAPEMEPTEMIQAIIEQAHSRHTYQAMLHLTKGDYPGSALEDQLVTLMLHALIGHDEAVLFPHWRRIASNFVTMLTVKFVNFRSVIEKLCAGLEDLQQENLTVGRNFLMWTVYQFIAYGPNPHLRTADLMVCEDLFRKLYSEAEPLPVPEFTSCYDVVKLGPAYLQVQILRRAKQENIAMPWNTPFCLTRMVDYILAAIDRAISQAGFTGFLLKPEHAAVVNCFIAMPPLKDQIVASKMDHTNKMAESLIDYMLDSIGSAATSAYTGPPVGNTAAPGGCSVFNVIKPLPMDFLDAVSVHIRSILGSTLSGMFSRIITSYRDVPGAVFLAPAFWETIARLSLYEEISAHILPFIIRRLPEIAKGFLLPTNFELLAFRMPHLPVTWKGNALLMTISLQQQYCVIAQHAGCTQALTYMFQYLIRTIQSFNVEDFSQPKSHLSETRIYIPDSEEITRLLLLTLFRLCSIVGIDHSILAFLNNHLAFVQTILPHTWGEHILATLPENVQSFYSTVPPPTNRTDKKAVSRVVDDTVQKLRSATNDMELMRIFETFKNGVVVIYCVIWRQLVLHAESNDPNAQPFKGPRMTAQILDGMNLKIQMNALRYLMDYVVADITTQVKTPERIGRACDCLSQMIWKFHILPFERVLLVTMLRQFEGSSHQAAILMVHLFCKYPDFVARLQETVSLLPPVYWECDGYFEKLVTYHQKFPEQFCFSGTFDAGGRDAAVASQPRYPMYFSNVVLRSVPLFDIIVQRFIELPFSSVFESVLDTCGKIFKYHDRPVTFLWQTFHFYDNLLKDNLNIRRKLVQTVIGHKAEHYPPHFYLTPLYTAHLSAPKTDPSPLPSDYFHALLQRFFTCIYSHDTPAVFGQFDWRFHEYPNVTTHALYTGCIELMSVPGGAVGVVEGLVAAVRALVESCVADTSEDEALQSVDRWINCGALFLSALPPRYFAVLLGMLDNAIMAPEMHVLDIDMMVLLDLEQALASTGNSTIAFTCQLLQVTLLQNNIDQTLRFLAHLHNVLAPASTTMNQVILLLKLTTPLLGKIETDKDRLKLFLTDMYQLVSRVASATPDAPDDQVALVNEALFYTLETYPVDLTKELTLPFVGSLPDAFQRRLRFLTQATCSRD